MTKGNAKITRIILFYSHGARARATIRDCCLKKAPTASGGPTTRYVHVAGVLYGGKYLSLRRCKIGAYGERKYGARVLNVQIGE